MSDEFTVADAVAVSMLALDASGIVRSANPAFSRACGLPASRVLGLPFARLCDDRSPVEAAALAAIDRAVRSGDALDDALLTLLDAAGTAWPVRASLRAAGAARWLTLLDRSAEQRVEQLEELLDMTQQFGRLGVWERDLRTMQGRWDRHMHRFWGLPVNARTPDFVQAARYVVDEDRDALEKNFFASTQAAGSYTHHYRVKGADGVVRRLHSQWVVHKGDDGRPARAMGLVMDDTEIWRLAKTIDETHAQLELALQLGGIAIWRHDLVSNRVYYDDQGWRILGLAPRPDGLSLDEVRALIHPDDLPGVQAAAQRALEGTGSIDMEARYRHASGPWLDILMRRVTQRSVDGKPLAFIGVALDVTERLSEQRRLQDLTRRLELAASVAGVAIWSYDMGSGQTHWNAQMYALHGVDISSPPPDLFNYLRRFVPPESRAVLEERARRLADAVEERVSQADMQIMRADGTLRDVSVRVRMLRAEGDVRMLGTMIDVTEQRAGERALREAHERAALAARSVGLGTWDDDRTTGQSHWDDQMWRLRGLEPRGRDALPEHERLALVHPDDRPALLREYEDSARDRRPGSALFRVRWPDGSLHWLASRSLPFFDSDGREVRRIGVNWDVTEAREAEQARQERLLAQRESRAKSQFLARMSHELRTPLNAVIGFAQLLLADSAMAARGEATEQLQHIRAAGEHLLALVNDVLDLSSLDTGEIRLDPQPVELGALYDAAAPMVASLAAAHGVTLQRGELAGAVLADPTRLRQVLLNLLTNAVKYNRRGGTVQVESTPGGSTVSLRVRDSGRGMAREQLTHAFEPFNRLGLEGKGIEGTGIGLAIVKANVERMGGTVQVQSTPGLGSEFEVRLPAAAQATDAAAAKAAATAELSPAKPARGGRLLYIEDNPVNALIVRELIAQRGNLTLAEADDGASGVASARSLRPDLILVDMQLPDIDGLEVLRRLRADPSTAAIPCIALSANAMPEDIQRALGAGFADYWTKPLDFRVFLGALDTLFGKRS
jgi:PAS domain S-box-containing protein